MSSVPSASGSRDPLLGPGPQGPQGSGYGPAASPGGRHHGYQRHAGGRPSLGGGRGHGGSPQRVAQLAQLAQRKAAVTRVLSLDSLHLALQDAASVSYLDTGDVCSHHLSQPDLHRVFVSDFI